MSINELTRDQIIQLKSAYYTESLYKMGEEPSYGELAEIDDLVSDEQIYAEYGHISFTEDDFGC